MGSGLGSGWGLGLGLGLGLGYGFGLDVLGERAGDLRIRRAEGDRGAPLGPLGARGLSARREGDVDIGGEYRGWGERIGEEGGLAVLDASRACVPGRRGG